MSVAGEWQHLAFMYDMEQMLASESMSWRVQESAEPLRIVQLKLRNETRIYLNALEVKSCAFTSLGCTPGDMPML